MKMLHLIIIIIIIIIILMPIYIHKLWAKIGKDYFILTAIAVCTVSANEKGQAIFATISVSRDPD